jgi:V/A-type H+-transporting ATPase subunit E
MALDDIIKSIVAEAEAEADEIKKGADQKIAELKKDYQKQKDERRQKIMAEAETAAEQKVEQACFLATSKMRAKTLTKKQEIIESVYQKALKELESLSDNEQQKLMGKLIKNLPDVEEAEIVAAKGSHVAVRKAVDHSGRIFKLSPENVSGSGGFVLRSKTVDIDNRFEALIKRVREETEIEVAKILFKS